MSTRDRAVVVVGVDGSTGSRDAVRWAAGYARLAGAELRAVASWRWPNYLTRIPPGIDLAADTRRTLQEVTAEIGTEFPDVPLAERVIDGPAGPALLSQAADASLLVVGAQGRAAFPGMLLGSVAEYCVRNGPCPVVVVRAPARSELLITERAGVSALARSARRSRAESARVMRAAP